MEDISPDLIKKFEQEGGSEDSSYEEESEVRSFFTNTLSVKLAHQY